MSFENILVSREGSKGVITLNRPEKLNAASDALMIELRSAIEMFDRDESVRVLVITGAGRAFCAGFDLGQDLQGDRLRPRSIEEWRAHFQLENAVFWSIWTSRLPVIAAVNGYCLGLGCDLAAICDLTIASEIAEFGEPEVFFQTTSQYLVLPWVIGLKKSKEIMLLGERFSARDAQGIGLVNRVVAPDELMAATDEIALKLAKMPPTAVSVIKEQLHATLEAQGFRTAVNRSTDLATLLVLAESEEAQEFFKVASSEGLKAAFRWRDARFANAFDADGTPTGAEPAA
jgi:enoyl-CoA hydratase/carnithine racemase